MLVIFILSIKNQYIWPLSTEFGVCVFLQEDLPLHSNFIPLDIRLQNWEELPPEFNHSENRRQVCVCVHVRVCVRERERERQDL